jgi:hypothetical protein
VLFVLGVFILAVLALIVRRVRGGGSSGPVILRNQHGGPRWERHPTGRFRR